MSSTTNYNLNIPSGSDQVNILTQITPNFETIDGVMKSNEDAGIQAATELYSNNIHALTRTKGDAPAMRFTATSNYTSGDTFTVDGVQVTALAPNGAALPDNAYVIGCEVFAILKGTRLTVWAGIRATDSEKLNGESAAFYATKEEVNNAQSLAESAATLAQNALDGMKKRNVGNWVVSELPNGVKMAMTEVEAEVKSYASIGSLYSSNELIRNLSFPIVFNKVYSVTFNINELNHIGNLSYITESGINSMLVVKPTNSPLGKFKIKVCAIGV